MKFFNQIKLVLCLLLFSSVITAQKQTFSELPIFENKKDGYECYRIPAIIKAPNGHLLAFAEGRKRSCHDFGDVDIVLRISNDNGQTWNKQVVVADNKHLQAGNPAPVVDLLDPKYPRGRIFLFYNTGIASESNTRKGNGLREAFFITSTDNGKTWSTPKNITASVHRPKRPDLNPEYNFKEDWRSYANTPGHALQLNHGKYKGRLFIPANHSEGEPQPEFNDYRAHAFYSDDHGETWQLSKSIEVESSNESTAVQLRDGRVMQNIRQQNGQKKMRLVAISDNGGSDWNQVFFDNELISPVCQASILSATTLDGNEVLLFSNPASTEKRENMTVRMSYNNGTSWDISRAIRTGEAAYSDLVQQADGMIGLLYEHGNQGGIHYAHFNFDWLKGDNNKNPSIEKRSENWNFASSSNFQLADPIISATPIFFEKTNEIKLSLAYDKAILHYTLDGSEPTKKSPIYNRPIFVEKTGILKAKAFHSTIQPSNTVSVQYFKINQKPPIKNISLATKPSDKYPGTGVSGLVDLEKGGNNFHENKWMGFSGDHLETIIEFSKETIVRRITASTFVDPNAWIFSPSGIDIYSSSDGIEFNEIAKKEFPLSAPDMVTGQLFYSVDCGNEKSRFLKIVVKNIPEIPEWHPGSGTPAWLFIDEILIE